MKEYDLSDRKLKIGVVLAVVIIGWLCLRGASSAHAQAASANLSPGVQEVVKLSQARMTLSYTSVWRRGSNESCGKVRCAQVKRV
jgi:hypothetical protein